MKKVNRQQLRERRKRRVRIVGTDERPRLNVYRSNKRVYVQMIDDNNQKTIIGVLGDLSNDKENKTLVAFNAGKKAGEMAIKKKIKTAVFDRNGYKYHGRVKAVLEGALEAGINFKK